MSEPTLKDMMAAYAEDAVDYATKSGGKVLDYSPESIAIVEDLAATLHKALPKGFFGKLFARGPSPAQLETMCKVLGGYVGEVIRRERGGEWSVNEELNALGLQLGPETWAFPVAKVHRRLINGSEDNLESFYRVMMTDLNGLGKADS